MNTGSIMARSANSNNDAGVTQLEFHQAMRDFKTMFPDMDEEVIEYVLRSNNGAVDSTIDQLLLMASDSEKEKSRTANAIVATTNPVPTTTIGPSDNVLSVDDLFFGGQPSPITSSLPSYTASTTTGGQRTANLPATSDDTVRPIHNQLINLTDETDHPPSYLNPPSYNSSPNTQSYNEGLSQGQSKLKDCNLSASSQISSKMGSSDPRFAHLSYPVYDTTGILSQKVSNTSLRARFKWIPPILGKLPDSFLRIQVTTVKMTSYNPARSSFGSSPRYHQPLHGQNRNLTGASPSANASSFISSAMLQQKMAENERRRQQAIEDEDEEVARYLEDERFAILLQNAEFVHELRHNQEFMSQLEMDNKRRRQESGHMQLGGSGSNYNSSSGPSSMNISDAAFKEALKNMGKKSKKKFAQLAGVFKKKKGNLFNDGSFGTGIDVTSSPHRQSRDLLLDDYKEFENEYSSDSERDRNSPYWERDPRTAGHPPGNTSSRISTSSSSPYTSQQNRH